jgi:hypothetical protein
MTQIKCHWYDGITFDNFEWHVYHFVMKLGQEILREKLSPEQLKKANYCSLCTQRAIADLGK